MALFGFIAYLFNGVASDTHATLNIVSNVTDPQAQKKQLAFFFNTETAIFRSDCDAKAHMFAIQDQLAGRPSNLGAYQGACAEIQPPPATLPR